MKELTFKELERLVSEERFEHNHKNALVYMVRGKVLEILEDYGYKEEISSLYVNRTTLRITFDIDKYTEKEHYDADTRLKIFIGDKMTIKVNVINQKDNIFATKDFALKNIKVNKVIKVNPYTNEEIKIDSINEYIRVSKLQAKFMLENKNSQVQQLINELESHNISKDDFIKMYNLYKNMKRVETNLFDDVYNEDSGVI